MATRTKTDFCIKPGYRENPGPVYFLDDVTTDRGIVFQPDVYTFAAWAARLASADTIVDIGCGWGDKLAAMYNEGPEHWRYVGIDYGDNIEHCRSSYPWGRWIEHDLEQPLDLLALVPGRYTIICSDVIEHLVDPTNMLAALKGSNADPIILSTPERDLQYGYDHMGPSQNLCHIREWNGVELRALLERAGLTVNHVGLTRGSDQGPYMATQLVVCTP